MMANHTEFLYFQCPLKICFFDIKVAFLEEAKKKREIQNLLLLLALNYEKDGLQVFFKKEILRKCVCVDNKPFKIASISEH
jgi:hypothetical protein